MRALLVISTILSLLTTAYCYFEYQMPHAQWSKVLSELLHAGIKDPDVVSRIRWGILGAQTTWKPLLVITSVQSGLLLALTFYTFSEKKNSEAKA
jgi:hypothetical protein